MQRCRWTPGFVQLAAVLICTLGGVGVRAACAGRMACVEIVREVDRRLARTPVGQMLTSRIDPRLLAKELGQDARWVERCMRSYGRRVSKPAPVNYESKEEDEERWEEMETGEIGPEEVGEASEADETPEVRRKLRRRRTPTVPRG